MAIKSVTVSDFLVFSDEVTLNFINGINVIIGENGCGKTSLLKVMYSTIQQRQDKEYYFLCNKPVSFPSDIKAKVCYDDIDVQSVLIPTT